MRAKTNSSFCNSTPVERKIDVWSIFMANLLGMGQKTSYYPTPGQVCSMPAA